MRREWKGERQPFFQPRIRIYGSRTIDISLQRSCRHHAGIMQASCRCHMQMPKLLRKVISACPSSCIALRGIIGGNFPIRIFLIRMVFDIEYYRYVHLALLYFLRSTWYVYYLCHHLQVTRKNSSVTKGELVPGSSKA